MPRTKASSSKSTKKASNKYDPPTNIRDRERYNRARLANRLISEGREVTEADFPDLMNDFQRLGWTTFLTHKGPIYPAHIREFYADFQFNDQDDEIMVQMFDQTYTWSLRDFGEILDIPFSGERFYSPNWDLGSLPRFIDANEFITNYCFPDVNRHEILSKGVLGKHLLPKYNLWAKFFGENMLCKAGNHANIHATQAALIHCLATETPVNLAYLVASRMSGLQTDTTRSLPYGILLSKLLVPFFSHLRSHVPKPVSRAPINRRTLKKMGLSGSKRSTHERDDLDELDDFEPRDEEEEEEAEEEAQDQEIISSDEELVARDPFYSMSSPQQREILYRQNLTQKRETSKIKKLLKKILHSCQSSRDVETGRRGGRGGR